MGRYGRLSKSRSHVRKDVLKNLSNFTVESKETLEIEELLRAYKLYLEVSNSNYAFNNVEFPFRLFEAMNKSPHWEFILFRLKDDLLAEGDEPLVGVAFTYKTQESYCGVLLGMDYAYSREYKVYKQILFHATMRARAINKQRIYLGLTSSQEKRKYVATLTERVGYIQSQDNYKLELIESMAGVEETVSNTAIVVSE